MGNTGVANIFRSARGVDVKITILPPTRSSTRPVSAIPAKRFGKWWIASVQMAPANAAFGNGSAAISDTSHTGTFSCKWLDLEVRQPLRHGLDARLRHGRTAETANAPGRKVDRKRSPRSRMRFYMAGTRTVVVIFSLLARSINPCA
jgi:hypothetical protein